MTQELDPKCDRCGHLFSEHEDGVNGRSLWSMSCSGFFLRVPLWSDEDSDEDWSLED